MRLGDLDALCEFFQKRYEYLRNASERQLPNGYVEVDLEIQCGAIIAKEFLDKAKAAPTIDPVALRPKGEWEIRGGKLYCTHCGERAAVARDREDFWYTKGTKACPSCGAKMEGGEG